MRTLLLALLLLNTTHGQPPTASEVPSVPVDTTIRLTGPIVILGATHVRGKLVPRSVIQCAPGEPAIRVLGNGNITIQHLTIINCQSSPEIIHVLCVACIVKIQNVQILGTSAEVIIRSARTDPLILSNVSANLSPFVRANREVNLRTFDVVNNQLVSLWLEDVLISHNTISRAAIATQHTFLSALRVNITDNTFSQQRATPASSNASFPSSAAPSIIECLHSSLNLTRMIVSNNTGCQNGLYIERPKGSSVVTDSVWSSNHLTRSLLHLVPHSFFTDKQKYDSLAARLEGWLPGPDAGPFDSSQQRMDYYGNRTQQWRTLQFLVWNSPLYLRSVALVDNTAGASLVSVQPSSPGEEPGRAYVVLEGVAFTGNSVGPSPSGGLSNGAALALLPHTEVEVVDCRLVGNEVHGDLLRANSSSVVIQGTRLEGNYLTTGGQAVRMGASNLTMMGTHFVENVVDGGLLTVQGGALTLTGCQMRENTGGGIVLEGTRPTNLTGNTLFGNDAAGSPITVMRSLTLTQCGANTFMNNQGPPLHLYDAGEEISGGGVNVSDTILVNNTLTATNNDSAAALAIWAPPGVAVVLSEVTSSWNTLGEVNRTLPGGGIYLGTSPLHGGAAGPVGIAVVDSCQVLHNRIPGGGAGIASSRGLTLRNTTFRNNEAGGEGGGLLVWGSSLDMDNVTLWGNRAQAGGGVAANIKPPACATTDMRNCPGGDIRVVNGIIGLNVASARGSTGGPGLVPGLSTCPPGNGGGLCLNPGGNITLANCTLAQNQAQTGGAVHITGDCHEPQGKCAVVPDPITYTLSNLNAYSNQVTGSGPVLSTQWGDRIRLCCGPENTTTCTTLTQNGSMADGSATCKEWSGNVVLQSEGPHRGGAKPGGPTHQSLAWVMVLIVVVMVG